MSPSRKSKKSHKHQVPLPPCKGPKLSRFRNHGHPVEFVQLLSDPETAAHSHIFEVKIGGKSYALKVFRYYDLAEDEIGLSDQELGDPDLMFHIDPFFAECRAFGRISDEGKNGVLAVRCFGFLLIPAERETELWSRFEVRNWDRPETEYSCGPASRQPLRAIVKNLVAEETVWNVRTSKKILQNLKSLHALGVYVLDVRDENIVGGQLVDFSVAWTEPHVLSRMRAQDEGLSPPEKDLLMFDAMMEDLEVRRAPRALPDREYCKKLRSAKP